MLHFLRFLPPLLIFTLLVVQAVAQKTLYLNDQWTFNQVGNSQKHPATVPGNVQYDMLNAGLIKDPFLGLNEHDIAWMEQEDWLYEKKFSILPSDLKSEEIFLNLDGLDTYADVYLNGKLLLHSDNMFVHWRIPVKKALKIGENLLKVQFRSTYKIGKALASQSAITYPADNEQGSIKMSPFIRKAAFQFGWDFAPRLLTVGIWKPVWLQFVQQGLIDDVQVVTHLDVPNMAKLTTHLSIEAHKAGNYALRVKVKEDAGAVSVKTAQLKKGSNKVQMDLSIQNPKLWWPNGAGSQNLYTLEIDLMYNNKVVHSKALDIGLRNIQVINEADSIGESFYFKVNGRSIYVKGANFVPVSAMPNAKADSVRLERLFKSMKDSHFNMIRVWGGGMYEQDYFYDLADQYGIMVWQDFPFACTMYPSNKDFLRNVALEATQNIKRLRNRASLAIWCGNNEIDVGWKNWGWQQKYGYTAAEIAELEAGYQLLFKNLLPSILKELDPERFYFHSSPISNWGKAEEFNIGDNHHWGVYHGEQPFEAYAERIPRFNSEFGFQSFPSWTTLKEITQGDVKLDGPILKARQKSYKGNDLLTKYMKWYYQLPQSDEDYVYLTQLQQAEGMKLAILASRASQPHNMGVLIWQLNDVWPAISWSAIEFSGKWKAAQYFIQNAFKPIVIYAERDAGRIKYSFISDLDKVVKAEVQVWKFEFSGKKSLLKRQSIELAPGSNALSLELSSIGKDGFLYTTISQEDQELDHHFHYDFASKDLDLVSDPEFNWELLKDATDQIFTLRLTSKQLVKNVSLSMAADTEIHFSENYFDMLPGQTYVVKFSSEKELELLRQSFKWMSVKNQKK